MKKRKIKWKNVIIALLIVMIMIGGCTIVFMKINKKVKTNDNNYSTDISEGKNNRELEQESEEKTTISLEKAPKTYQEFQTIQDGEYLTEKGYTLIVKDGIAYIDNLLIVNKTYSIPNTYQPTDPYQEVKEERCNNCINKDAMEAYKIMESDARSIGLNIYISSGYRSYNYQEKLYNNYVARSGKEGADTYSARPGHSEHQSGTCFDLNTVDDSFANTDEGRWINEHAYLYGFIIRYPKGKESITGYQYESWHLRYVGKELATKLYNDGNWLTIEEYYGISSTYE